MCAILDLPRENGKAVSQYLRDYFNTQNHNGDLQFYFEDFEGYPRVIVKGQPEDVLTLMNEVCSKCSTLEANHEV